MMIRIKGLKKSFLVGPEELVVLDGISLDICPGEFLAIMGKSGSGKSTLLHILGCLDSPTGGSYWFEDQDVLTLSDDARSFIRANKFGFVFQSFNLISELTLFENVELPFLYRNDPPHQVRQRVQVALGQVDLLHRAHHKTNVLSGGEMQRVAIARALATHPDIIFADEPTGNLDEENTVEILKLFQRLHQGHGKTIVMITHDQDVAACAEKKYVLTRGQLTPPRPSSGLFG